DRARVSARVVGERGAEPVGARHLGTSVDERDEIRARFSQDVAARENDGVKGLATAGAARRAVQRARFPPLTGGFGLARRRAVRATSPRSAAREAPRARAARLVLGAAARRGERK